MKNPEVLLLDDIKIQQRVAKVWAEVFLASSIVIDHSKKYGFLGMEIIPNPNIRQLLLSVRLLEEMIDTFINHEELEYEEKRLMLNAKKQLTMMNLVAAALTAGNHEDFNVAMNSLETQAAF